mgnify:CR=1 FL=1
MAGPSRLSASETPVEDYEIYYSGNTRKHINGVGVIMSRAFVKHVNGKIEKGAHDNTICPQERKRKRRPIENICNHLPYTYDTTK